MRTIHKDAEVAAEKMAAFLLLCEGVEVQEEPLVNPFPDPENVLISELLDEAGDPAGEASCKPRGKGKKAIVTSSEDGDDAKMRKETEDLPYPWYPDYECPVTPPPRMMELLIMDRKTGKEKEVLYSPFRPTTAETLEAAKNVVSGVEHIECADVKDNDPSRPSRSSQAGSAQPREKVSKHSPPKNAPNGPAADRKPLDARGRPTTYAKLLSGKHSRRSKAARQPSSQIPVHTSSTKATTSPPPPVQAAGKIVSTPAIVISPPSNCSTSEAGSRIKQEAPSNSSPAPSLMLMPPSRSGSAFKSSAHQVHGSSTKPTASSLLISLAATASRALDGNAPVKTSTAQGSIAPSAEQPADFANVQPIPLSDDMPHSTTKTPPSTSPPTAGKVARVTASPETYADVPSVSINPLTNPIRPDLTPTNIPLDANNHRIERPLTPLTLSAKPKLQTLHPSNTQPCLHFHTTGSCIHSPTCKFSHSPIDAETLHTALFQTKRISCRGGGYCRQADCFYGHHCSTTGCAGPGSSSAEGTASDKADGKGGGCAFGAEAHLLDHSVARFVPARELKHFKKARKALGKQRRHQGSQGSIAGSSAAAADGTNRSELGMLPEEIEAEEECLANGGSTSLKVVEGKRIMGKGKDRIFQEGSRPGATDSGDALTITHRTKTEMSASSSRGVQKTTEGKQRFECNNNLDTSHQDEQMHEQLESGQRNDQQDPKMQQPEKKLGKNARKKLKRRLEREAKELQAQPSTHLGSLPGLAPDGAASSETGAASAGAESSTAAVEAQIKVEAARKDAYRVQLTVSEPEVGGDAIGELQGTDKEPALDLMSLSIEETEGLLRRAQVDEPHDVEMTGM